MAVYVKKNQELTIMDRFMAPCRYLKKQGIHLKDGHLIRREKSGYMKIRSVMAAVLCMHSGKSTITRLSVWIAWKMVKCWDRLNGWRVMGQNSQEVAWERILP